MSEPGPRGRRVAAVGVGVCLGILAWVGLSAQSGDGARDPATAPAGETSRSSTTDPSDVAEQAALDGLRFTDVSESAGLVVPHSTRRLVREEAMTSGVAVVDIDADGDHDLYLTRVGAPNGLLLNDGSGRFEEVAGARGAVGADPEQGSSAAAFADFDGDGDLDLYVTGAGKAANVLYRNDDGAFIDATASSGLTFPPQPTPPSGSSGAPSSPGNHSHGVTVSDYDHDGDADLLVLHWDVFALTRLGVLATQGASSGTCEAMKAAGASASPSIPLPIEPPANRSRLFRNDGTGRFEDVTAAVGLELDEILAFTGQFVDVDGDGWEDLLIAGDSCTSRLYRNEAGQRFTDITASSGVGTDENGMGSVVRDIDRDGDPDWFVTSIGYPTGDEPCPAEGFVTGCSGNRLYLNGGGGRFDDGTDAAGVRDGGWGWGAAIEDFSNAGRLDIVMTNGYEETDLGPGGADSPLGRFFETFREDRMRLWVPTSDGHVEAAPAAGLDHTGLGHGLVAFDADLDGDLDLVVAESNGSPKLYRNDTPPGRGWLRVRLSDPARPGNRDGWGAAVLVTPRTGDLPFVGWVGTDGSYESQRPAEIHVGLGDLHRVARIDVYWPGAREPQTLTDVEADRVLVIERVP